MINMMMTTMTSTTTLLAIILAAASTTQVDAACTGSGGISLSTTSPGGCVDCLSIEGCNAWFPSIGTNGECFPSCLEGPADSPCYTNTTLGLDGGDTVIEDVCQLADNAQADALLCNTNGATSCAACTSITLSDGFSTCLWFNDAGVGYCSSDCGRNGCGTATCGDLGNGGDDDDDDDDIGDDTSNCTAFTSCTECFEMNCAWLGTGRGCLEGCDIIADISCYDQSTFPGLDAAQACDAVIAIESEELLCDQQSDCTSCVSTTLSSGSTCLWNEEFSFCSNAPTLVGPGTTVCNDASTQTCVTNGSCEECLGSSCAWAPVQGCLPSCDMIADTSCYSMGSSSITATARQDGGVGGETPESICALADSNTADDILCSGLIDCGSCVSTVLSDGQSTCKWFGTYCSSLACDMVACGSETCDNDPFAGATTAGAATNIPASVEGANPPASVAGTNPPASVEISNPPASVDGTDPPATVAGTEELMATGEPTDAPSGSPSSLLASPTVVSIVLSLLIAAVSY